MTKRTPTAGRGGARTRTRTQQAARREALREQESARRARESRQRRIRFAVAGLVIVVVGAAVYFFSTQPRGISAEGKKLMTEAPAAATEAGCTGVRTVPPYPGDDLDGAHIGDKVPRPPPLSSYPSTPPASGPHDPSPLDAGVYTTTPNVYRAIHSLEHGAVVLWYSTAVAPSDLAALRRFFGQPSEQDHVIVAPYSYPDQGTAGELPSGHDMVLVAWHHVRLCERVSLPVAYAFVNAYAAPGQLLPFWKARGYRGDAPEAGAAI